MSVLAVVGALAQIVPSIAGWIGGDKAEEAADHIAGLARTVTGIDDPEEAIDKVQLDPTAQLEFMKLIEEQRTELDKLYLADRQDARNMQIETLKYGRSRVSREFIYWYAACLTLFACGYIAAITFMPIPESGIRFADTALGFVLGTVISAIIQFFYGSSRPLKDDE